jgi:hypothetical protein
MKPITGLIGIGETAVAELVLQISHYRGRRFPPKTRSPPFRCRLLVKRLRIVKVSCNWKPASPASDTRRQGTTLSIFIQLQGNTGSLRQSIVAPLYGSAFQNGVASVSGMGLHRYMLQPETAGMGDRASPLAALNLFSPRFTSAPTALTKWELV